MAEGVPPGRAARLWLRGRIDAALRNLELLDRQRRLLRRELEGLAAGRDRTGREWAAACVAAQRWGTRAAAVGGALDVELAAAGLAGAATVELPQRNTMGVRHPGTPVCHLPVPDPRVLAAASGTVGPAAAAYRAALHAAATHAAADRSYRVLEAELRSADRRRRAVEHRRLPALEAALRQVELRLDEHERQERIVARWVLDHPGGARPPAPPGPGGGAGA